MPVNFWNDRKTRVGAALAFIFIVVLMGGGSRGDIMSLPLLRGLSVLFAAYAVMVAPPSSIAAVRVPLILLGGLALLGAIQLLPLPHWLWSNLPYRDLIAAVDKNVFGQPDMWRALSLAPGRTWNMLLSLTVPLAALLVFAAVNRDDHGQLLYGVVGAMALSMLVGIGQLAQGSGSGLYLYRITNEDSMVGLFANRNHHAMALAVGVIIAGTLLARLRGQRKPAALPMLMLVLGIVVAAILVLAIGSRGGLLVLCVAIAAAWYQLIWTYDAPALTGRQAKSTRNRNELLAKSLRFIPLMVLPALAAIFLFSPQNNSVRRLVTESTVESQRAEALPTLMELASQHWLLGSGFGSFDPLFRMVEPDRMLRPNYLNQAHNDWLQWVIEGGMPAILLFAVLIVWLWRLVLGNGSTRMNWRNPGSDVRFALLVGLVIMGLGSIGDYPLRVPSVQMLMICLIALAARARSATAPVPRS